MKKVFLFIMLFGLHQLVFPQAPEAFNYQVLVRDAGGNLVIDHPANFFISILEGGPAGFPVYMESHFAPTNQFGHALLRIGQGAIIFGNFSLINWGGTTYYLKTEVDLFDGNGILYMGSIQLLSVPYALYAKTSGSSGGYIAGSGIDITSNVISNTAPNALHSGDATGSDVLTVVKIQGRSVQNMAPAINQILKWNGSAWSPSADDNTTYSAGTGLTLAGTTFNSTWTASGNNIFNNNSANVGIGTSNPTAKLQVNGTVKMFGAWEDKTDGVNYQAPSDGFVIAGLIINSGSPDANASLKGYTDSNPTPVVCRGLACVRRIGTGTQNGQDSFTMPVRKGDYWRVEYTYLEGSVSYTIYWIPLGQ